MPDGTVYTVNLAGPMAPVEVQYGSLTDAIAAWDRVTATTAGVIGGIQVQTFKNGLMVRDGWILHVRKDSTYLNPSIMLDLAGRR
jgi:hypothetical protein